MKIYTSYFWNIKNISNPVSIALSSPKWYNGPRYMKLAPTWEILNEFKTKEKIDLVSAISVYEYTYSNTILKNLTQKNVLNELQQIYKGEDVVLLCYEAPEKFCHRHLVAKWFYEAGIEVKEVPKIIF